MRLTSCCGRSGRVDTRADRIFGAHERARPPGSRRGSVAPRAAEPRSYVMCPPVFLPTGRTAYGSGGAAMDQWETLRRTLIRLGHRVGLVPGRPGLPGMVFAARAATVVGDRVLAARRRVSERSAETPAYLRWFDAHGFATHLEPVFAHEGECDLIPAGPHLLAAAGPHTEYAAHAEAGAFFGLPVVALELADPRFTRLGSALALLGEHTAAYYPGAFTSTAQRRLARMFGERVEVAERDALAFGLDVVSDGRNVVMGDTTPGLAARLTGRGFRTIELDMSAYAAHGVGPRGCVLELRADR